MTETYAVTLSDGEAPDRTGDLAPEGASNPPADPWWLGLVFTAQVIQLGASGLILVATGLATLLTLVAALASPVEWQIIGWIGALSILALYFCRAAWLGNGIEERTTRGWAVTFAQFFWRSAVALAVFVLSAIMVVGQVAASHEFLKLAGLLFPGAWAVAMVIITTAIFRDRELFGVERRFGWRTVRSEAGWILLAGAFVELVAIPGMILMSLPRREYCL